MMYKAEFMIKIEKKNMTKICEIIKKKWNVKDIICQEFVGNWKISFLTSDHRKVFAFKKVVANYGGIVLRWCINKMKQSARKK